MSLPQDTYDIAIKFLIDVGKLAASELKERWTLARQKGADKKKAIDLSNNAEIQQEVRPLLQEVIGEYGEERIRKVIELANRKQDLIFEWRQQKIDVEQEYNRQKIDLSSYRFQIRDLDQKISTALKETRNDLEQLGIRISEQDDELPTIVEGHLLPEPVRVAALRLDLDTWTQLASTVGDGKVPDRLIHDQKLKPSDEPFTSLSQFLTATTKRGLAIEVYSGKAQISSRISNPVDFWLMLLSSLSLDAGKSGVLIWLIKETVKDLKNKSVTSDSTIYKLWKFTAQQYCNQLSPYYRPNVIDFISSIAIESANQNHGFLFLFFSFLYKILESDLLSTRKIAENLERFAEHLGNNAPPSFLERLKYLIGIGRGLTLRDMSDTPRFEPHIVAIPANQYTGYEFQTMINPLTVYENSVIRRVPPQKDANPSYPLTFAIVSDEGESLFNILTSDVRVIINLCNDEYETDKSYQWDVPTTIEWLSLADCLENHYPWGNEPPTPKHANLDFGTPSKLRPVGTYPLGTSKFGVQDCCGNVHEIVRISSGSFFPEDDFRLAGGCYQTNLHFASCQIIRPFKPKESEDNRRNVGLRLIRFRKEDEQKRFIALEKFLSIHLALIKI
jgi:hypothetical protein